MDNDCSILPLLKTPVQINGF